MAYLIYLLNDIKGKYYFILIKEIEQNIKNILQSEIGCGVTRRNDGDHQTWPLVKSQPFITHHLLFHLKVKAHIALCYSCMRCPYRNFYLLIIINRFFFLASTFFKSELSTSDWLCGSNEILN